MTADQIKRTLNEARDKLREGWQDSLPDDIQRDLERIYDELKWIIEDIE